MTELERARDVATIAMMDALEVLLVSVNVERDTQLAKHLHNSAEQLEVASVEQHNDDRNGATGKEDCAPVSPPEHCQGCSTGFSLAKAICCECIEAQKGQATS